MSTRAAVEELLRRIGEGDAERIADAYAEEVDWQLNWPADEHGTDIPWIRHRSTRADVADHFRSIAANHDPEHGKVHIDCILVDGIDAVVMGTIANRIKRTDKSYLAHFALHITVENGLITRHHVYEDSLSVARAWENK
ncbi:MAG: nuclear transport factor 2 family protein [Mycobacteriales bacterium]